MSLLKLGQFLRFNLARNPPLLKGFKHFSSHPDQRDNKVRINVITRHDGELSVVGIVGDLLYSTIDCNAHLMGEFGSCRGNINCGTCIVKLSPEDYEKISDLKTDEEQTLIENILERFPEERYGCSHARLACQVHLNKAMDGIVCKILKPGFSI
ncbi:hypothetical protein CHUAL_005908 [Chamberlinius hualienensis]